MHTTTRHDGETNRRRGARINVNVRTLLSQLPHVRQVCTQSLQQRRGEDTARALGCQGHQTSNTRRSYEPHMSHAQAGEVQHRRHLVHRPAGLAAEAGQHEAAPRLDRNTSRERSIETRSPFVSRSRVKQWQKWCLRRGSTDNNGM